jgi:hypothetical protein
MLRDGAAYTIGNFFIDIHANLATDVIGFETS